MKTLLKGFFFAVIVLLISACAGGTPQSEPVTIKIDMKEYTFEPANIEIKVGQQVTFELVNSGVLQHEILFGRQVMKRNNRPAGYEVDMFQTAGVEPLVEQAEMTMQEEEHAGFMIVLPKSGTASMTFPVTEAMVGEWEIGCFEQDGVHYDAGMKGTLVVKP
ncbi:MAG: hypothetical protein A2Z16_04710 [Chloroflexi bacterium RBG_16_54_18]|nr:MAG: hypothetical protein A2Z16_04710 [Chloroflexi bacterium RBG_16_54_18]